MRVVHLPKRTETSLITESDQSGPNHQLLQLRMARTAWFDWDQAVQAMHSCNSWLFSGISSLRWTLTLRYQWQKLISFAGSKYFLSDVKVSSKTNIPGSKSRWPYDSPLTTYTSSWQIEDPTKFHYGQRPNDNAFDHMELCLVLLKRSNF